MLSLRENRWLKVIAIATVLAFMPAQTSWAGRGRRGGNTSTGLIVAAIGGAAMPLTAAFAGPNASYAMLAGSVTSAFMTKAGCDPHTTSLVSAAASGVTSAGLAGGFKLNSMMVQTVVKRLVSAEVSYELSQSGWGAFAGLGGSLAGAAVEEGMIGLNQNTVSPSSQSQGGNNSAPDAALMVRVSRGGLSGQNLPRILISGGVSGVIYELIKSGVGDRSLALMYAGNISSLGGNIAEASLLPEQKTYYGVAEKMQFSNEFKQEGPAEQATAEQVSQLQRQRNVEYDAEQGLIKVLGKDNKIYSYKATSAEKARYIGDMANRGYDFWINPNTKQLLVLYEYKRSPVFAWDTLGKSKEEISDLAQSRQAKDLMAFTDGEMKSAQPREKVYEPITMPGGTFKIESQDLQPLYE